MPNWCQNNIKVEGKGNVVKHFILENFRTNSYNDGLVKVYELDFEKYDPTPIDDDGEIIKDWYTWRLEHWGCKWSPTGQDQYVDLEIEKEDGVEVIDLHVANENGKYFDEETVMNLDENSIMRLTLQIGCDTPWGPPIAIFEQWYKQYKGTDLSVEMKFYEPGCEILGEVSFDISSEGGYYEKWIENQYDKEGIMYKMEVGWEGRDWYIEECGDMIREMQPVEVADKLVPEVEKMLAKCTTEEAATLIADIYIKYFEWLQGDDTKSEPSKE